MKLNGEFENKAMSFFHLLKWKRFTMNIEMNLKEANTHESGTSWKVKIGSYLTELFNYC